MLILIVEFSKFGGSIGGVLFPHFDLQSVLGLLLLGR